MSKSDTKSKEEIASNLVSVSVAYLIRFDFKFSYHMMNAEPPTNILTTLVAKFPLDELDGLFTIFFRPIISTFITS